MTCPKLIGLQDQRKLTPEELEAAQKIGAEIGQLADQRENFVRSRGLDYEIAVPGANWSQSAENSIHKLFALVRKGDYEILNSLRLFTQPFSGYDLATMEIGSGAVPLPKLTSDFDDILSAKAKAPDSWIKRFQVITERLPKNWIPSFPKFLGEIGWEINGRLVNHDVYSYQERLNLLYESGILPWLNKNSANGKTINILEIGAGYGGLGYALTTLIPGKVNYFVCDIPESLIFSAVYLRLVLPDYGHFIIRPNRVGIQPAKTDKNFYFLPNYLLDEVSSQRMDLVINTLSLAEMTRKQVNYYGDRVTKFIGKSGVFFEQNHDCRSIGLLDCKPIIGQYFCNRFSIVGQTIPVVTKGQPDVWSNRPLSEILGAEGIPISGINLLTLKIWKWIWLMKVPEWAFHSLGMKFKKILPPKAFIFVRHVYHKLGGKLPP